MIYLAAVDINHILPFQHIQRWYNSRPLFYSGWNTYQGSWQENPCHHSKMRQGGFKILARCLAFIPQLSLSLSVCLLPLLRNWHRNSKVSPSRKPPCVSQGREGCRKRVAYAKMASQPSSHPGCPWPQEIDSGMSNEFSSHPPPDSLPAMPEQGKHRDIALLAPLWYPW